ncbi:hypothetical protein ASG43_08615 [Aureimonas sp. Leaf454]|uniref:hypothetical protein n=1 Tax=Aureimonas sp. Leaf454 TaxID=1736381 RepID=UPI00070056F4|nr:hypothetical protein [Aureimonas sp. Leaf454]KQT48893.1 hypothetical protein ASG43_08615 [Aureimonas sp. Leaf454]
MSESERKAVLSVERGLHMLTYRPRPEGSTRLGPPPVAEVVATTGTIVMIAAPGSSDGALPSPGSALVLRAETAGTIEVTLRAAVPGGSLAADFELKTVGTPRVVETASHHRAPPAGVCDFTVTAHVSLRGDLTAARGDWICGPGTPGRIEGLDIQALGGDLPLEIQVASGGRLSGWSPWLPAGTYAGSRGKSSPLVGVRLRLTPQAAPDLALRAEANFLGAPVVTRIGRDIELTGSSLLDPLVGFRLDITTQSADSVEVQTTPLPAPIAPIAPMQPSRLRVFRRATADAQAA